MSKNGIALGGKALSNKQLGLLGSTVSLGLITILIYTFNSSQLGYQFNMVNPNNFLNAFTLNIGIDGLSIFFVLLTAFILPLAILSNWKSIPESNDKTYTVLMLILETLLLTIFLVLDILGFYIFFESILAPLYILIGIYGSANKEKAAYFLLLFTLAGSLIMLLGIGTIYDVTNSTSFNVLFNVVMSIKLQSILWIAIFVAVMVKTPVFPLHTWLPVVHSESPLGGSIILAGIILKLAVYSCIRILIPIFAEGTFLFVPLIFVIGILTIIYTSLVTTRQMDVKVIIAYSSIGHMGTSLLGIFANNLIGIEGSLILNICHGFVSPALFICVGGILYDRYHVRIVNYFQGLTSYMPIFMVYFFLFSLANIGTPLSGNFVGEFLSLAGAFQRSPILTAIAASGVLLTAIYMMKFNSRLTGGVKPKALKVTNDLSSREIALMNILLLPVFIFGLFPSFFTDLTAYSASTLIYTF